MCAVRYEKALETISNKKREYNNGKWCAQKIQGTIKWRMNNQWRNVETIWTEKKNIYIYKENIQCAIKRGSLQIVVYKKINKIIVYGKKRLWVLR